jgi:hypothetical protein
VLLSHREILLGDQEIKRPRTLYRLKNWLDGCLLAVWALPLLFCCCFFVASRSANNVSDLFVLRDWG